ncbi:hypothetical protein BDV30DRAFT_209988 [Aspergillus minisclerotigenes]|uniref:Glycosyltransferase family 31 protein n=1 Tax=Aspergillus minisclerotigenes TaxID=656917 RepID=A0A5N6J5P3_9EURO|nr:hypothetical protein BDV30DRAFT_209988 [Aspergillus minisclerotigenes]
MPSIRLFRMRQSVKSIIAAAIFLTAGIFFLLSKSDHFAEPINGVPLTSPEATTLGDDGNESGDCYVDLDLLKSHGYKDSAQYERWEIAVRRSTDFKGFSDKLSVPAPTFQKISLNTDKHRLFLSQARCSPTVTIEAPTPRPRADASHMVFGVSTSLERLSESLEPFAHWAGGTGARIFAMVDVVSKKEKAKVLSRAQELDIKLTIIESKEEWLDRYFRLTKVLWDNRDAHTQWAVIIDDDTFFPSMSNLVDRLATYDATKPYYIGAPTENWGQMNIFSFMAYGGAGIFLSLPLLQQMNEVYDECYAFKDHGDKRISQCIYQHTTTKLTWDRGLFQVDFGGDVTGFFESGRPLPLSIHHWKSWYDVDVVALARAAEICGDDCQLRRWRISDKWYFVNGFSLVQYSSPMNDMIGMEQTWDPSDWAREQGYAFSLGPLRPKDEGKKSYRMKSAVLDNGRLRQIYVYEPEEPSPPQILEVVWTVKD